MPLPSPPLSSRPTLLLVGCGDVGLRVLALLRPDNRKLKLFVPQKLQSGVHVGQTLALRCDGCASGLQARVNFIASGPEFTPPVIYSVESRQKLVVLVEAELLGEAMRLSPGQIVDIELATLSAP